MDVPYSKLNDFDVALEPSSARSGGNAVVKPDDVPCSEMTNDITTKETIEDNSAHIIPLDLQNIKNKKQALDVIEQIKFKFNLKTNEKDFEAILATPMCKTIRDRLPWLVGLLLFQSVSAFIMHKFENTLDANLVVAFFIPMLVGTGGNAGNQPGVMVTRALSTGDPSSKTLRSIICREIAISFIQACTLSSVAFFRVIMQFPKAMPTSFTVAISLFGVVLISASLGVSMSLILHYLNIDPANAAAPIVSTVSDLIGILLLCSCTAIFLGSEPDGKLHFFSP